MQSKLASEKAIREAIEAIATEYKTGWSLRLDAICRFGLWPPQCR